MAKVNLNCDNEIKLDIACGDAKREGYIGIDISPNSDADIIRNIEKQCLPFCDCLVDKIFSKHTLEHIRNIIFTMNEFWRILKPKGELEISLPHRTSQSAIGIMHVRYWDEPSFDFFRQERSKKLYGLRGLWEINEMVVNQRKDMYVRMKPIKENKEHKHNLDLDIGCGQKKYKGSIGLDKDNYGQEIIWDIRNGLPFCNNSCKIVRTYNILEHLGQGEELLFVMTELHRIIQSDGILEVLVPYAGSEGSFRDPTHKSFWTECTFDYFTEGRPKYYDLGIPKWKKIKVEAHDKGKIVAILTPIKK